MRINSIINRIQIKIENLYEKLNKTKTQKRSENIQNKILALYEELYTLKNQINSNKKICPVCNKEFIAPQKNSVCCSLECYNHYYYLKKTKSKRAKIRESKPLKEFICAVCGKTFYASSSTRKAKYCSDECRKEHYRQYNKEYALKNQDKIKEWRKEYYRSDKYKEVLKRYHQTEKYKNNLKKYRQTEKYKEARKKYTQTENYRELIKRYQQSEKGKETRKKYTHSDKYKKVLKKYRQSEKYKETRKKYLESLKENNLENTCNHNV